jgi:hypothetical protein
MYYIILCIISFVSVQVKPAARRPHRNTSSRYSDVHILQDGSIISYRAFRVTTPMVGDSRRPRSIIL